MAVGRGRPRLGRRRLKEDDHGSGVKGGEADVVDVGAEAERTSLITAAI